jgi:hypothetical protein
MANSTASILIKPIVAFNRGDTFVFGSWVCTADGTGSFQCRLTMTPNSKTGLVMIPEVITGTPPENSAKFRSTINTPTSSLDPSPTQTRCPPGSSHASWLLSHRVRISHSTSTSRMVSATLAGPMRKLSSHAGPARRSPPTTVRTPTPLPASTQTLRTSSTSGRTLSSPYLRSPRPRNRCHAQPLAWL